MNRETLISVESIAGSGASSVRDRSKRRGPVGFLAGTRVVVAAALFVSTGSRTAAAQTSMPDDALRGKLEALARASDDLQQRLPNFGCRETLVSQELRADKVKNEVRATGDLRIDRGPDGNLIEHFRPTERNGKPASGDKLKVPVFLLGGFKSALDLFQPAIQACFRFQLSGDRIDFESAPGTTGNGCAQHSGTRGFALLDPDGNIAHLERRTEPDRARERNAAPFAAVDFKQVELGGTRFSLSSHVTADTARGGSGFHWEAGYSECRLFHVTVTLGPAGDPVPETRP